MPVKLERSVQRLVARLFGEIDHHSARELREEIDDALSGEIPEELVLDFEGVTFMDSSGIGLVMGRYNRISIYGGRLVISGLGAQQKKVMRLAGLDKIALFTEHPQKEEASL